MNCSIIIFYQNNCHNFANKYAQFAHLASLTHDTFINDWIQLSFQFNMPIGYLYVYKLNQSIIFE